MLIIKDERTVMEEFHHVVRSLSAQGFTLYGDQHVKTNAEVSQPCISTHLPRALHTQARNQERNTHDTQRAGVPVHGLDTESTAGWAHIKHKLLSTEIDLCIDLTHAKAKSSTDPAYLLRRMAVDHGISLINNSQCAVMFVDALHSHDAHPAAVAAQARPWDSYVVQKGSVVEARSAHGK